jgi:RsiW-degrading membrane proteinase PrsW (M82 family)
VTGPVPGGPAVTGPMPAAPVGVMARPARPAPAAVPPAVGRDRWAAARWAALAGLGATVLYGLEILLNATRPRLDPSGEAWLTTLAGGLPGQPRNVSLLVLWSVATGVVAAVVLAVLARAAGPSRRRVALTWGIAAALLLPYTFYAIAWVVMSWRPLTVACFPTTALALLVAHRSQKYARVPVPALLAGLGWGGLVAAGIAGTNNDLASGTASGYIVRHAQAALGVNPARLLGIQRDLQHALGAHAGVVEELAKGAGILLVLLWLRGRGADLVAGIVIGAATGLGFNLSETILYMDQNGGIAEGFQFWIRQSATLAGSHTAFSAMVGAGFGAAVWATGRRARLLCAAGGLLAGIGGHVASDTVPGWLGHVTKGWVAFGGTLDTVLVSPLLVLVVQIPFIVVYVLLLRQGVRAQAAAFGTLLEQEVATGYGTVTAPELPVLLNPAVRLWTLARAWRRYGARRAVGLGRLQGAQLELARWRWWRATEHGMAAGGEAEGARLRGRVLWLKAAQA